MDEFKQIGRDLWNDKPLLIAVLVAAGVLVYLIMKNGASASTATSTTGSTLPTGAGGTYVEESYNNYAPTSTVTNTQTGMPMPITTTTAATGHNPGTTFLGPTGVKHYVATGSQTLSQIASQFGLAKSWNAIYAIPDNQKLFGKLNASQARTYTPIAGQTITLPPGTAIGF